MFIPRFWSVVTSCLIFFHSKILIHKYNVVIINAEFTNLYFKDTKIEKYSH